MQLHIDTDDAYLVLLKANSHDVGYYYFIKKNIYIYLAVTRLTIEGGIPVEFSLLKHVVSNFLKKPRRQECYITSKQRCYYGIW